MADDKSKVGKADRDRVAAGEDYEARDFAKANGITVDQAKTLIRRHGNNRVALAREAKKLRDKETRK